MTSPKQATEKFRHTPFVCGYLGSDTAGHWAALLAAAPAVVKVRSTGPLHGFAASRAPGLEKIQGRRAWVWGRHLTTQRAPSSWREAAHEVSLAGFWAGPDGPRVHTDAMGNLEIYARELDGTTYFANRIDPLARLGSSKLHTDWEAWGEHLLVGGMSHARTPFAEVRRLAFGESRLIRDGRSVRVRDLPAWMQVDRVDGSIDAVLEAVLDQMPPEGSQDPTAIGLSGGWDSRFIGMLLAHRGVKAPVAFTAHKDMGGLEDVVLAGPVAQALGMEHHLAGPNGPSYWSRYREQTLRRFEHELVLHTWLAPMSDKVRRLRVPVWDGLHGDAIFRSASVGGDLLWAGPRPAQREAQWIRLGGQRMPKLDALRFDLTRRFHDDARVAFRRDTEAFTGLANELLMRSMTTKGTRVIASSSTRLLAPEVPIRLPFAAPTVVEESMKIPAVRKAGTGWYLEMMARINPEIARMPSTNDPHEPFPLGRGPGQMHPRIVRLAAEKICADPVVLAMFAPRAQNHLREGLALRETGVGLEALQWAEALASWRSRYLDLLADERL